MALSDSRRRAQGRLYACSEWAPAGCREASSHGSGVHGETVSLLKWQLFLLSVSSCSSLPVPLQYENSTDRINNRSKSCRIFHIHSFWFSDGFQKKKKKVGDFYPDLDIRIKIRVTQCVIKAWLTRGLYSFSISVSICILEYGERGGVVCFQRGVSLLFWWTYFFQPVFSVLMQLFVFQWEPNETSVLSLLSQTFPSVLGCSVTPASSLDPFMKTHFLMASAFLQTPRVFHVAFTYKSLSSEMKLNRLSISGPAKQKNLKH